MYFVTTATRNTSMNLVHAAKEEEFLRSGTPLPSNILQPLLHDSALEGTRPCMSALRFTKVTSSTSGNRNSRKPIVLTRSKLYPAFPILSVKYRVISCTINEGKPILLLSIEISTSTVLNTGVKLLKVDLTFTSGEVRQKTQSVSARQFFELKPGDETSLLYEITMNDKRPKTGDCNGKIIARVDVPKECSTRILLDCKEYICDALEKANIKFSMDEPPYAFMEPYDESKNYLTNTNLFHPFLNQGVAITISGPQEVRWGEVFFWNILIVNRTHAARRCCITLLQDNMEEKNLERKPEHCHTVSQTSQEMGIRLVAQDNTVPFGLLASQGKAMAKETSILCLSPEIRIE